MAYSIIIIYLSAYTDTEHSNLVGRKEQNAFIRGVCDRTAFLWTMTSSSCCSSCLNIPSVCNTAIAR